MHNLPLVNRIKIYSNGLNRLKAKFTSNGGYLNQSDTVLYNTFSRLLDETMGEHYRTTQVIPRREIRYDESGMGGTRKKHSKKKRSRKQKRSSKK